VDTRIPSASFVCARSCMGASLTVAGFLNVAQAFTSSAKHIATQMTANRFIFVNCIFCMFETLLRENASPGAGKRELTKILFLFKIA